MCAYQHVIRLHDSFWVADTLYICTELCAGGTLADRIEADGPMAKGTAARFLKTLADFANDCLYEGTLLCGQIVLAHPGSVHDGFARCMLVSFQGQYFSQLVCRLALPPKDNHALHARGIQWATF